MMWTAYDLARLQKEYDERIRLRALAGGGCLHDWNEPELLRWQDDGGVLSVAGRFGMVSLPATDGGSDNPFARATLDCSGG